MCLNNSSQFFWKYMCVKKCVEMRVMLFKNWKHVFKILYQTAPKFSKLLPPNNKDLHKIWKNSSSSWPLLPTHLTYSIKWPLKSKYECSYSSFDKTRKVICRIQDGNTILSHGACFVGAAFSIFCTKKIVRVLVRQCSIFKIKKNK